MENTKIVVVTGGAQGIGRAICEAFSAQGAAVCIIDVLANSYFVGDIADEDTLKAFRAKVLAEHGGVDYLINNACLSRGGLKTCSYEVFNYTSCGLASARPFCSASSLWRISNQEPALSTFPPPAI